MTDEVRRWFDELNAQELAQARRALNLIETSGPMTRMPHSRPLGGGLYELRFRCGDVHQRVTYAFLPGKRIILFAQFRKQRDNERIHVRRARAHLDRYLRRQR
jgi:hypothetical protein